MSDESEYDVSFEFPSFLVHAKECSTRHFDNLDERSAHMQKILDSGRKLDRYIDNSDLFSPNDLVDDISTASLKYLLVPFLVGEFLLDVPAGYNTREQILKDASMLFKKFIDRLDLLLLITPEARGLLDSTIKEGPNELRKRKIHERLRENELLPKYEYLEHKWVAACLDILKKQDENRITASPFDAHALETEDGIIRDEREILLDWFDRCVYKVVSHMKMIKQEEEILAFHNKEQEKRDLLYKHGQTVVDNAIIPLAGQQKQLEEQQQRQGSAVPPHPVSVSTSGVSTGGLKVHSLETSDDAKRPIPAHMAEYMVKANAGGGKQQQQGGAGNTAAAHGHHHHHHPHSGPCNHPNHEQNMRAAEIERQHQKMQRQQGYITGDIPPDHVCNSHCKDGKHAHIYQPPVKPVKMKDIMTDDERLAKPWFNPTAGTSSAGCSDGCGGGLHWEDVTQMPELPEYTLSKIRGKSGQLVKTCPIHRVAVSTCGCDNSHDIVLRDRINTYVDLRVDRTRVFRDRNPYLMELDDWAKMKIDSGDLPGEKDRILAERIQTEEERHRMRVEQGESDDEDQLKSERQLRDEEEEAQLKARSWADWTDDHQKGAGNKNYRR